MYLNNQNIKLPKTLILLSGYLDLSKFFDLLMSQKLFMSRSDKFEDQYEGTFSEPTFEEIRKLDWLNPDFKILQNTPWKGSHQLAYQWIWILCYVANIHPKQWRTSHTIHNWSIAKRTPENNYKQYIGEVNYIDYKKEYIPFDDMFPFFYSNEKLSVRAWSPILSDVSDNNISYDGLKINVNIDQLIEKILHPSKIRKLV
jgi:hypothetical protein